MESIETEIVVNPNAPSANRYMKVVLLGLRVNEIALATLLKLCVGPTKPGPSIETIAGDVPAGN